MRITTKLLLGLILTVSMFAYISCNKLEIFPEPENANTSAIEEKFFNSHRSSDPTEKALVNFLKKINQKNRFVSKTVEKIGYPRWDKIMSLSNAHTTQAGREPGDSVQVFYVPFVRDSQNFVNASMLLKTTPTDTSFYYKCDWQFRFKEYGSPYVDSTAEKHALLFMLLDKATFGYNEFKLIDSNLFRQNNSPVNDSRKLVLLTDSTYNSTVNSLYYHEICFDTYICGTIEYCAEHGGCDYLNCPTGQCQLLSSVCEGWWDDFGGGNGETPGSPVGGAGGAPGGGSTPPDCGTIPTARTVDPCDEGPGWTPIPPVEDEPIEPFFNYSYLDNPIFVPDDPVEMPTGYQFNCSNFDINSTTPIRVIGKTNARGNTEDMQYGNNCDASGILSNMPNFPDAQLFAEVEDLFHKTSTGALETVGDNMIDRFRNNIGGQFSSATLSQAVFGNSKFQNFIVKFGKKLHLALSENNWNINQVSTITMPQSDRPAFNGVHNKFHGLQILINDTEESIIELTSFSINATTHKWTADLKITIKDHFGLDKNDALTYQNSHAGFAAWWILQHCRGYKPFETNISFNMQLQTQ